MDNRFEVVEIKITNFIILEDGLVKFDLTYPDRVCILDNEREIVVDIDHKLEYDYIKISPNNQLLKSSYNKIKQNKRAAIHSVPKYLNSTEQKKVNEIIEYLKEGGQYTNGNLVLNNEQYLERIAKEIFEQQKKKLNNENPQKVKKIGSIFRKREK